MGMKKFFVLFACVLVVLAQSNLPTFAQYVVSYGKTYSTAEYTTRQTNYNNRVSTFTTLNGLYNMTSGVNSFTDWTTEELTKLRGYKALSSTSGTTPYVKKDNPPSAFDWRSKNSVTSVKNQLMCQSDWAFASVAYAESKLVIDGRQSTDINLSEQRLLECTTDSSCSGGYLERAMDSVVKGIPSETIYSYKPGQSSIGVCTFPGTNIGAKVQSYYNIADSDIIQLLQQRPVTVAVASKGWQTYSSGVFTCTPTDAADHAVLLIGYNSNYWIVKNSWGDKWGENGYMRISRTAGVNCKIGSVVVRTFEWHMLGYLGLLILVVFGLM